MKTNYTDREKSTSRKRTVITFCAILAVLGCILLPCSTSQAGTLSGSLATGTAFPTTNLTAEGTEDWAIWNDATLTKYAEKDSPGAEIGSLAQIGTFTLSFSDQADNFSWTDGAAANTGGISGSAGGVVAGRNDNGTEVNEGFRLTFDADTTLRTAKIYVLPGRWDTTFTATLSDGSATPVVTALDISSTEFVYSVFTVNFAADTAGETLTLDWTISGTNGNSSGSSGAYFAAASLVNEPIPTPVPEPLSIILAAMGVSGLGLCNRRRRRARV